MREAVKQSASGPARLPSRSGNSVQTHDAGSEPALRFFCRFTTAFAIVLSFAGARADTHDDVVDVIASMAAALSNNNAPGFLQSLDKGMPGYDRLALAIPALLAQGDIVSSVEPVRDEGDEVKRSIDLDWYMEIRNPDETAPVIRRREVIHCRVEKQGKHWRITSLDPLTFFDPENFAHK